MNGRQLASLNNLRITHHTITSALFRPVERGTQGKCGVLKHPEFQHRFLINAYVLSDPCRYHRSCQTHHRARKPAKQHKEKQD